MLDKRLNGLCWFHKFFCKEIYIHANHVLRLQNIHIVGTPFLDPRLREGPMNSVPYVRTKVEHTLHKIVRTFKMSRLVH